MRNAFACAVVMLAGCTEPKTSQPKPAASAAFMIGKAVIVTSKDQNKMGGDVLVVDPASAFETYMPIFVPPFRAVVLKEVPRTDVGTDNELSERWQVKVEEGIAVGRVVNVTKRDVDLIPVK